MAKANGKKTVPAEEIIRVWQAAESVAAAAKTLGMREGTVRQRVYQLRLRGVPLKRMAAPSRARNIAALTKLAKESLPRPTCQLHGYTDGYSWTECGKCVEERKALMAPKAEELLPEGSLEF